jgi:hypothetical protein
MNDKVVERERFAGSEISTACECLSLTTLTTTKVATITVTIDGTAMSILPSPNGLYTRTVYTRVDRASRNYDPPNRYRYTATATSTTTLTSITATT